MGGGWGYTTLGMKYFKGSNGTNVSSFHILKMVQVFKWFKTFKCLKSPLVQMVQGFEWFQGSLFSPPLQFSIMFQLVWLAHAGGTRVQVVQEFKLVKGLSCFLDQLVWVFLLD